MGEKKYRLMGRIPSLLIVVTFSMLTLLVLPVSAGLVVSTQGAEIMSRVGSTSPVIMVTDTDIPEDGNITIDITQLWFLVANLTITDDNVEVTDDAVDATWTRQVEFDGSTYILNLTSTGGPTHPGENVTVTFTGAAGGYSSWVPDTYGETAIDLVATRSDTLETSDTIIFLIILAPGAGGLAIAPGPEITSVTGTTQMVITITDEPILQNDIITIPVMELDKYVATGSLTDANVIVTDDAAAASWSGYLSGGTLLLTSENGETAVGENITVTFTGAQGSPWKAGSSGDTILEPLRWDTNGYADFNFAIHIAPPQGYNITARFTANRTTELAPLAVAFTDHSVGNPTSWDWDWGDGTAHDTSQNPIHTYSDPGTYFVSLTASNAYSSDTLTKNHYIHALNGGITTATTTINGLTITNCGGPQTVTVNTDLVPADLIPDTYVLEIQPPAESGLKNITIYAQNGAGFTRDGHLISGSPTRVHLESADMAPPGGFSNPIGTDSTFNFSLDLPRYPCNAVITTKIREGILPADNAKLEKICAGQTPAADILDTAYTATITKTNLPTGVPVKVRMSVNSTWNTVLAGGPGWMYTWRIADDGNSGQILPTDLIETDPVKNLHYYEADSPLGMSTFGLSSFVDNNNPFQLITLSIAAYVQPQNENQNQAPADSSDSGTKTSANVTVTPNATVTKGNATPSATPRSATVTGRIYANQDGVVSQPMTLASLDGFMTLVVNKGVVAKGADGNPLQSISLTPVSEQALPGPVPAGAVTFAGRAFEIQPEGATFSPGILISFTAPANAPVGQEYTVKMFDHASAAWQDVPTTYDAGKGMITAQVSRFCCFALFAKTITLPPAPAETVPEQHVSATTVPAPSSPPPSTAIAIFWDLIHWITGMIATYPLIIIAILAIIIGIVYYERTHW